MAQIAFSLFVGIDWATQSHQVCVLDQDQRVVSERSVEHSGAGIAAFADWLCSQAPPDQVAVSIETPRGAIVETLVERGFAVYSINPKQMDRFRDRHTVAGAKDDRRDAFVLADSLRTDLGCYRRVHLDDPLIIQLRELSRADDELRQDGNRATNRLREQLHRFFPQMLVLCSAADELWLWALLKLVPTPLAAAKVGKTRIDKLLRQHRIRRVKADEVVAALRAPALYVAPGVVDAATAHITLLLPRLRLIHDQRRQLAEQIEALLDQLAAMQPDGTEAAEGAPKNAEGDEGKTEHRDVEILRSLPGVGKIVAATVLAEASWALAQRDYHGLRSHAGVAPVTRQSGKRHSVSMRHSCSGRLRNAIYHWSRVASQHDPGSRAYYQALRARGKTHGHALRVVGDRLLRILVAMLSSRTLYDKTRHLPQQCSATEVVA